MMFEEDGLSGLAVNAEHGFRGLTEASPAFPGPLESLVDDPDKLTRAAKALRAGRPVDIERPLPALFARCEKIICVGLNYVDHAKETNFTPPDYPTLFLRVATSLVGHNAPLLRPRLSEQFDYEGELTAVVGKGGRRIEKNNALDHVAGYTIFNDASVRDYQFKTPQWTAGKNFDGTGAIGPVFVTADELPPGCHGQRLTTRLNGSVVQSASVDDLIFDVATLVSVISEIMTLKPGDLIVTGTPSGVGLARKPPLWMKAGDVCEVEVNGLGVLRNVVVDD
jgi:acylpyruvate hydrolase